MARKPRTGAVHPNRHRARLTKAEVEALGLQDQARLKRVRVKWMITKPTSLKFNAIRNFLRLPQAIVLDMAIEALVAFINERHLASGGDESGLISWNSDIIDNPAFYRSAAEYWGGWSDSDPRRTKSAKHRQPPMPNAGEAPNAEGSG